jgi:hypothetical protein
MATLAEHRRDLDTLLAIALRDLDSGWRDITTADAAREAMLELLPRLTGLYGSAAATLAADWYDDYRATQDIAGSFRAVVAELPDRNRTEALARWGIGPLFGPEPDFGAAKTLIAGGFQRIVLDASRQTIAGSSVADPKAEGWQRLGQGSNCAFCQMLIDRGAVYQEATAAFASHDHCNCYAAPAFHGVPRPVEPYTRSRRVGSDADRARVREYLRTH